MKTVAIIVSYNPVPEKLKNLINSLGLQVFRVVIIDNASFDNVSKHIPQHLYHKVDVLTNSENIGIGAAQNVGISYAIKLNADYILLSDQDSIMSCSMVDDLINVFREKNATGFKIAAVGPAIIDSRSSLTSFFVGENFGIPCRQHINDKPDISEPLDVSFLLSSGSLISVDSIKIIGLMRSNYFIDHVDTEWCLRAKKLGYKILGIPNTYLYHELGDAVKTVWFFGKKQVMYHSPLRNYYMFRNTLLMMRDIKLSWIWRFFFFVALV